MFGGRYIPYIPYIPYIVGSFLEILLDFGGSLLKSAILA